MTSKAVKQQAKQSLQGKWGVAIGSLILASGISGTLIGILYAVAFAVAPSNNSSGSSDLIYLVIRIVGGLFAFGVTGSLTLGLSKIYLDMIRGKQEIFEDLFSYLKSWKNFKTGWSSYLLPKLYVIRWALLFIVPGIIKSLSYAMTPYILIDHPHHSVKEAITKSREMMDGYKWKLFKLRLSFLGWILLCIITVGLATIWVAPYMQAAETEFYHRISGQEEEAGIQEETIEPVLA